MIFERDLNYAQHLLEENHEYIEEFYNLHIKGKDQKLKYFEALEIKKLKCIYGYVIK